MNMSTVALEVPAELYSELQSLAQEEQHDMAAVLAELVKLARQRHAWLRDLAMLRIQIAQDGGLQVGATKDEVAERLRQTRRIFSRPSMRICIDSCVFVNGLTQIDPQQLAFWNSSALT